MKLYDINTLTGTYVCIIQDFITVGTFRRGKKSGQMVDIPVKTGIITAGNWLRDTMTKGVQYIGRIIDKL